MVLRTLTMRVLVLCLAWTAFAADPPKTGNFEVKFDESSELSSPYMILKRTDVNFDVPRNISKLKKPAYDIRKMSFQVYVPKDYKPWQPYGLMVYVAPGDGGRIPGSWRQAMEELKMIWIGADNSGNEKDVLLLRVPLAVDAHHNMTKRYNIDPDRVYASGLSGGGRVVSHLAPAFPDIFTGAISICGVNYWENLPVGNNRFVPAGWKPKTKYRHQMKKSLRYVLLTGEKDYNRTNTRQAYDIGYKKDLRHATYMEVPGLGHTNPDGKWFKKAVLTLDAPLKEDADALYKKTLSKESRENKANAIPDFFRAAVHGSEDAQAHLDELLKELTEKTEETKLAVKENRVYDAYSLAKDLVKDYGKGFADNAYRIKKRIEDNKEAMREVEATAILRKIEGMIEKKVSSKKTSVYLQRFLEKYKDTQAATRAQELLDGMKDE